MIVNTIRRNLLPPYYTL